MSEVHMSATQLEGGGRGAGLYALPGSLRFWNLLSMSPPEFITGIQLRLHLPLGVLVAAGVEAPGEDENGVGIKMSIFKTPASK